MKSKVTLTVDGTAYVPIRAVELQRLRDVEKEAGRGDLERMNRQQLLALLELLPQRFWPPRPSRQDKRELIAVVRRALRNGRP